MDEDGPSSERGEPQSRRGPWRLLLYTAVAALGAAALIDVLRLIARGLPPAW